MRLRLSRSGDGAFGLVPKTVSGDVGEVAGSGEKQALWDVEKDQPDLLCDDCVVVEAVPAPSGPQGPPAQPVPEVPPPAEPAKPAFPADFPESWAVGGVDDAKAYQHGLALEKKGRLVAAYAAFMAAAEMGNTQAADRKLSLNPRLDNVKLGEAIRLSRTIKPLLRPGIPWVTIPGGSFMTGDEEWSDTRPVHRVTVKSFQMAKTEVTNKQYSACVIDGACTPQGSESDCKSASSADDQPVVCVRWDQAKAFAQWIGGRLPSEAEREYAARSAGKERKYPWGDEEPSCDRAVMNQGGPGCRRNATWPVCSKTAGNTEQGLCDMAGNVSEWTQDWHHDSYSGAPTDGSAWERAAGSRRVVRGGSWSHGDAMVFRAAWRNTGDPGEQVDFYGIRVAR